MQGRSWMAALALAAGVALAPLAFDPTARAAEDRGVVNSVSLSVRVNGLDRAGCEIEVKPGHPGCDFVPFTRKLDSPRGGVAELEVPGLRVKSTRVDRDCLFAITIKQPGQPPRTSTRSLILERPAPGAVVPQKRLLCMLQSPALAARDDLQRPSRR